MSCHSRGQLTVSTNAGQGQRADVKRITWMGGQHSRADSLSTGAFSYLAICIAKCVQLRAISTSSRRFQMVSSPLLRWIKRWISTYTSRESVATAWVAPLSPQKQHSIAASPLSIPPITFHSVNLRFHIRMPCSKIRPPAQTRTANVISDGDARRRCAPDYPSTEKTPQSLQCPKPGGFVVADFLFRPAFSSTRSSVFDS